jgi:hypothetical protein
VRELLAARYGGHEPSPGGADVQALAEELEGELARRAEEAAGTRGG